jgi:hypothetical protein
MRERADIAFVDTTRVSGGGSRHLTAEELANLQRSENIDVTLLIEADKFKHDFIRIAKREAPRLHGRNLGIFSSTAEWFPGEDSFTGKRVSLLDSSLLGTLRNVKAALSGDKASARAFYEDQLIADGVIDEILVKDERLSAWRGPPVYWMPEIGRPAANAPTAEEQRETEYWRYQVSEFRSANAGREPLLYFGDAAYYKGYDLFLQFLAATPNACGLHAGRSFDQREGAQFKIDIAKLRQQLLCEGRLLETACYIHSSSMKELFFSSIRVYITMHRIALSSATMIQALEYGKPVIVPDRGLLGHRVKTNALGAVYRSGDLDDLREKALLLWSKTDKALSSHVRAYWERFSDASLRSFFMTRLLSEG